MPVIIDISTSSLDGTWTLGDDGTPGNNMSAMFDPMGNLFMTFGHPTDIVAVNSRAGQNLNINLTESLGTSIFLVGDPGAGGMGRPDAIQVATVSSSIVFLRANTTINEMGADADTDILANTLLLDAGTGIGVANPIETQVLTLEAESVTGGINLASIGNLNIGGASVAVLRGLRTGTSGSINLSTSGSITLLDTDGSESVHSAGNVSLTAIGAAADITSGVNHPAISAAGSINLSAGRDVVFGAGSLWNNDVTAGITAVVTAGRDFHIDGNSDLVADGGAVIVAGRDILVEDDFGLDAGIGVGSSAGVTLLAGPGGTFSLAANSQLAINAGSGGVRVSADRMLIEADSGITATGGGTIQLFGDVARPIILGSATDAAAAVELSDTELDRLFAQNVIIGAAVAGNLTVLGAISHANPNLTLQSRDDILVQAGLASATSLTLRAGGNVSQTTGAITTGALNVFVDTPDTDVGGGNSGFDGSVTATSSTITGNDDADMLGGTSLDDTVWAGDGLDLIVLGQGGNDTAMGEGGNDRFFFAAAMTGADTAIGGDGADSVILQGNYAGLTMGASTLQGIEIVRLLSGAGAFDYMITMNDGNVGSGQFITINATDLVSGESLAFIGTAETDGRYVVNGGAGDDTMAGGARHDELNGNGGDDTMFGTLGDDTLFGGAGSDFLDGGADLDTLFYASPGESTSVGFDRLNRFEPMRDSIDLPTAVTGWSGGVTGGTLNTATFDADLATAINATLQPNMAAFYRPNAGTFAGRTFAVVDANSDGNYSAGADYVFEFVMPIQPPELTSTYFI